MWSEHASSQIFPRNLSTGLDSCFIWFWLVTLTPLQSETAERRTWDVLSKQPIFKLAYKRGKEVCSHVCGESIDQTSMESQGLCKAHKPGGEENGWLTMTLPTVVKLINSPRILLFHHVSILLSHQLTQSALNQFTR